MNVAQQGPAETMRLLRTEGHVGVALRVMRSADGSEGSETRATADSIADSLTAFVIANSAPSDWSPAVQEAMHAIAMAGVTRGVGRAYPGALDRLTAIVEAAASSTAGAMYYMTLLPDRQNVVARLARFASSEKALSVFAVEFLNERTGDEGVRELRRLQEIGSIRNESARRLLRDVASQRGWTSRQPRL